jgi:hypothetical protein
MARERLLQNPIVVTVVRNGQTVATTYNLVRFGPSPIMFDIMQEFSKQRAAFPWVVGRLNEQNVFEPANVDCAGGIRLYTNDGEEPAFAVLVGLSPTLAAIQDQVLSDLESDGSIGAGTERDYAMSASSSSSSSAP